MEDKYATEAASLLPKHMSCISMPCYLCPPPNKNNGFMEISIIGFYKILKNINKNFDKKY